MRYQRKFIDSQALLCYNKHIENSGRTREWLAPEAQCLSQRITTEPVKAFGGYFFLYRIPMYPQKSRKNIPKAGMFMRTILYNSARC